MNLTPDQIAEAKKVAIDGINKEADLRARTAILLTMAEGIPTDKLEDGFRLVGREWVEDQLSEQNKTQPAGQDWIDD